MTENGKVQKFQLREARRHCGNLGPAGWLTEYSLSIDNLFIFI